MVREVKASDIEKAVRSLVNAQRTNLGVEVTVPVAYGDGELATVIVEGKSEELLVHDAGFSAMRLTSAGISLNRHVAARLREFAGRYRCTFSEGRVSALTTIDDVATVACLVANASRSVADYAYEIRRHAEYDFRAVVFDKLREIAGSRVRETEEFVGMSGRHYRLPILLDQTQSRPQNFLAALANRQTVPQHFAMFYDLRKPYPDVEQDAVYDETADIREEDRVLIRSVGAQVFTLMEAPLRFREMSAHA